MAIKNMKPDDYEAFVRQTKKAMADMVADITAEMKKEGAMKATEAVGVEITPKGNVVLTTSTEGTGPPTVPPNVGGIAAGSVTAKVNKAPSPDPGKKEGEEKDSRKVSKKVTNIFNAKKPHKEDVKAALELLLQKKKVKVTDALHTHANMRKKTVDIPLDLHEKIPSRRAMRHMSYARFAEVGTNEINLTRINKNLPVGLHINKETGDRIMNYYNMCRLTTLELPGFSSLPQSAYDDSEYLLEIRSGSPMDLALALAMKVHCQMLKLIKEVEKSGDEAQHPCHAGPPYPMDEATLQHAYHRAAVNYENGFVRLSLAMSKVEREVLRQQFDEGLTTLLSMAKDYKPRGGSPERDKYLSEIVPAALSNAYMAITKAHKDMDSGPNRLLSVMLDKDHGMFYSPEGSFYSRFTLREVIHNLASQIQGELVKEIAARPVNFESMWGELEAKFSTAPSWQAPKPAVDTWTQRIASSLAVECVYTSPTILPAISAQYIMASLVEDYGVKAFLTHRDKLQAKNGSSYMKSMMSGHNTWEQAAPDFNAFSLRVAEIFSSFFLGEDPPGKTSDDGIGMSLPGIQKKRDKRQERQDRFDKHVDPNGGREEEEESSGLPDPEDLDYQFEDVDPNHMKRETPDYGDLGQDYDAMEEAMREEIIRRQNEDGGDDDSTTLLKAERQTAQYMAKYRNTARSEMAGRPGRPYQRNDDAGPGPCHIREGDMNQSLPGHMIGRKWKSSPIGNIVRSTHRWATDRWIFHERMKGKGVTLLLDASGSMMLRPSDIIKLIQLAPASTFAIYGGNNTHGQVRILARNGMCIDLQDEMEIRPRGDGYVWGGNVVDAPALKWLNDQPRPRIFVSDGWSTGLGNMVSAKVEAMCLAELQKGGIQCARNIDEAIKLTRAIAVGTPDAATLERVLHKNMGA
jgi:hypothetical protein